MKGEHNKMSKLIESAASYTYTENGALTYNTSGDNVLNLFALGGALRSSEETRIIDIIDKAWTENQHDTIATLLYIRDIRAGLGEKKVFRLALKYIADKIKESNYYKSHGAVALYPLFDAAVEFGSWKDIFSTFSIVDCGAYVVKHSEDEDSLLPKWMPSIGGSRNKDAEYLAHLMGKTPKEYRKWLTAKRKGLDIVETKLCARDWGSVNYAHVPSQANILYANTFRRHDKERYGDYIQSVMLKKSEAHINVSTLAPYQIVSKVNKCLGSEEANAPYQAMWSSLPDYTQGDNAIVVADTSGSMWGQPMEVATSLAIYFAERNKGIFRNEYINFSEVPKFRKLKEGASLAENLRVMYSDNSWGMNTNLYKVFELVLKAAVTNDIPEDEMPKTIYIVSDMEFDECSNPTDTVFESIKKLYANTKYNVPTLVFWNVNSHQNNLPVRKDNRGTVLVSGCSPTVFAQVISGDMNPYEYMNNIIHTERYTNYVENIEEVIRKLDF